MNNVPKNTVSIFSGPNFLGLTLSEYLLSKNFYVRVYTQDEVLWKKKTSQLLSNNRLLITSKYNHDELLKSNYSICVVGYDNDYTSKFIVNPNSKTIIISPFEKYQDIEAIRPKGENVAAIYLGDLLGPRMDLKSDLLINNVVSSIFVSRVLEVGVGEMFYPIFVLDAVKQIFSFMFSFGPYGRGTLLVGEETSSRQIWKINSEMFKNVQFKLNTKTKDRKLPPGIKRHIIKSDVFNSFKEAYKWLLVSQENEPKKPQRKKENKAIGRILTAFAVVMTLPIVTFLIAIFIYYLTFKNFSENKIYFARPFLFTSRETSRFLSGLPFLGKYYKEVQFASDVGIQIGTLAQDAVPAAKNLSDIPAKVLGNEIYNLSEILSEGQNNLTNVHKDFQTLNAIVNYKNYENLYLRKYIMKKFDLKKIESLLQESKSILENGSNFLGQNENKTYLILFQNNMELRPTGGFIGSYGLASFEKGRMIDLNVSDVYSADGQLKGHVEPPGPIKEYLNEANWFLRDSNWDPDFTVSAKRAEWFLDKEIGVLVDGVIAIDLSPIKDILDITGPIFLGDYNMEISSSNLYEKTQEEVEKNFFPGSRKKASFLTALSRSIMSKFSSMNTKEKLSLLSLIYKNLEERHIQIYLHDQALQKSLVNMNWDGAVRSPNCGTECYGDIAGVVEANLGVNKVNQFITRKVDMNVSFDNDYIYRKLTLTLSNSANPSLGPSGLYKSYVRPIKVQESDLSDGGQWIEVLPKSEKIIEFNWKSQKPDYFDINKYKIYFRKQAGVEGFPLSLTVDGQNLYNERLNTDLFTQY